MTVCRKRSVVVVLRKCIDRAYSAVFGRFQFGWHKSGPSRKKVTLSKKKNSFESLPYLLVSRAGNDVERLRLLSPQAMDLTQTYCDGAVILSPAPLEMGRHPCRAHHLRTSDSYSIVDEEVGTGNRRFIISGRPQVVSELICC